MSERRCFETTEKRHCWKKYHKTFRRPSKILHKLFLKFLLAIPITERKIENNALRDIDCEQSLFFFRFSKGSARARERWAAKPRDARREKRGRCMSRAFCWTDQEKRETACSLGGTTKSMMLVLKKAYKPARASCIFYNFLALPLSK